MNMKKIAPAAMSALLFGSALVPVASANGLTIYRSRGTTNTN